jgi:hypothetical protein
MTGFTELVAASLPPGLALPEAFVTTLDWLDTNDFVRDNRVAFVKPASAQLTSETGFKPVDPGHVEAWLRTDDKAYTERLALIIPTGGEGSYAALWRRDDGGTSIVHMGSGSGSVLMATLTDDPVDMLRLMAIGYGELCWPEYFGITPEEEYAARVAAVGPENVPPYSPPTEFRQFVSKTFGVTIPRTASEILGDLNETNRPDDPFALWLNTVPEN